MMSAPFTGAPPLLENKTTKLTRPTLDQLDKELSELKEPRKHYQTYFSSPSANVELMNSSQGIHQFLRAYYHHKSADWSDNQPFTLTSWDAKIMAQMPTYYIMHHYLRVP